MAKISKAALLCGILAAMSASASAITFVLPEIGDAGQLYESRERQVIPWWEDSRRGGNRSLWQAKVETFLCGCLETRARRFNRMMKTRPPAYDAITIVEEGMTLAKKIIDIKIKSPQMTISEIHLEGYGYGGAVACMASQLLAEDQREGGTIISAIVSGLASLFTWRVNDVNRFIDELNAGPWNIEKRLTEARQEVQAFLLKSLGNSPQFPIINSIKMVGTHHGVDEFEPNMSVVETCLNFYSWGDCVAGARGQFLASTQNRLINLRIKFSNQSCCSRGPGHYALIHSRSLQHWLPDIPSMAKQMFANSRSGLVVLPIEKSFTEPRYIVEENHDQIVSRWGCLFGFANCCKRG